MLLYTRLAPPKAPKRRSRAGCAHCKEKKKKCDEERPKCARCAERGLECVYEAVRPRQRRKRDSMASSMTAFSSRTAAGRLAQGNSSNPHGAGAARRWSGDSPRSTSSSGSDSDRGPEVAAKFGQQDFYNWQGGNETAVVDDEACETEIFSPLVFDAAAAAMPSPYSFAGDLPNMLSPSFASPSLPFNFARPSEADDDDTPATPASATSSALVSGRTYHPHHTTSGHGPGSDLAMIAPMPVSSPLLAFCPPVFSEIAPSPQGRLLVDHFCNVLSHLIVFREDSGNPFQKLVLPLSMASEPVLNAVYALASAHLEHRGVATALLPAGGGGGDDAAAAEGGAADAGPREGERSLYYHSRAIQGLARLIESGDAGRKASSRNELLAAIMLLVYYEVLVQKGRSNIVDGHLKGALTIMCSNPEPLDATGEFLERAFRFYDVIAALSFGTAPLSTAPAAGHFQPAAPLGVGPASLMRNVDTLLGMATTLWPIIHRLSSLSSLRKELDRAVQARGDGHAPVPSASKVAVLRTEFETTADAVEIALKQWRPCLPPGFTPSLDDSYDDAHLDAAAAPPTPATPAETLAADKTAGAAGTPRGCDPAHLHSIYHNAMAYRHSAFVYLYREVHELPRAHAAVQHHARLALRHCAATCSHAGPMSALLWPLFVAACEAASAGDRATARRAFAAVERRQGMANIGRAWDIVREVWRRADLLAAEEEEGRGGRRPPGGEQRRDAEAAAAVVVAAAAREREAALWMGVGMGCASRMRRVGGDLWRRVSEDMGVNIVFG